MAKTLAVTMMVMSAYVVASVGGWSTAEEADHQTRTRRSINDDAVIFPDTFHHHHMLHRRQPAPRAGGGTSSNETNSGGQVPLELARRFSDFENFESFVDAFVANKDEFYSENGPSVSLSPRFGGSNSKTGRDTVPTAKIAACIPDMTVVPLIPPGPQDPSVFHMPSCTRVPRCGGCCGNHLLSCQPTQTKIRTFKIYQLTQRKNSAHYKKFMNISVEEHIKCQCDCVLKEKDCGSNQVYSKNECRCICPGNGGLRERECSDAGRYWDSSSCQCLCPNPTECSTGSVFDHGICSCARK